MTDRKWMYRRLTEQGTLNEEFVMGVKSFIDFASSHPSFMDGQKIRCPCQKCKHRRFEVAEMVKSHLVNNGFVPNYFNWNRHGEPCAPLKYGYESSKNVQHSTLTADNQTGVGHAAAQTAPAPTAVSASHQIPFDKPAKQKEISAYELFVYTHTKKHDGVTFCNDKAREVHERYQALLQQKLSRGEPVDENQLYYEAVGGRDKKGRVYGLGSCADMYFPRSKRARTSTPQPTSSSIVHPTSSVVHPTSSSVVHPTSSSVDMKKVQDLVVQQVEKMRQQMQVERQQEKEELQKQLKQQVKQQVQSALAALLGSLGQALVSDQQPPSATCSNQL